MEHSKFPASTGVIGKIERAEDFGFFLGLILLKGTIE